MRQIDQLLARQAWTLTVAADKKLSTGALRVAMALPTWMGKDDTCFPSLATIGEAIGITDRHARRCVRELEKAGWLATVLSPGRSSSTYRLTRTPHVRVIAPQPGPRMSGSRKHNPDMVAPQPGQEEPPTRTSVVRLTDEQYEQETREAVVYSKTTGERAPLFSLGDQQPAEMTDDEIVGVVGLHVRWQVKDAERKAANRASLIWLYRTHGKALLDAAERLRCQLGHKPFPDQVEAFLAARDAVPTPSTGSSPDPLLAEAVAVASAIGWETARARLDCHAVIHSEADLIDALESNPSNCQRLIQQPKELHAQPA